MMQNAFSFKAGKRKFLFCADSEEARHLHNIVREAMDGNIPLDFQILQEEREESLVDEWFSIQKMGAYLYISGTSDFVKRIQSKAMEAGFSEHDMQSLTIGPAKKKLICCTCHGRNEVSDLHYVFCGQCGEELEVSDHYSRRLDAYLGYVTIK
jgi:dimethylamine monooxygenase subunit C